MTCNYNGHNDNKKDGREQKASGFVFIMYG